MCYRAVLLVGISMFKLAVIHYYGKELLKWLCLLTPFRSFHAEKEKLQCCRKGILLEVRTGDGDSNVYNFTMKEAYFL